MSNSKEMVYLDGEALDKAFDEFKEAVKPIFYPVSGGFERTREGAVMSISGCTLIQMAKFIEECRKHEMSFIIGLHSSVSGYPVVRLDCQQKIERMIHY